MKKNGRQSGDKEFAKPVVVCSDAIYVHKNIEKIETEDGGVQYEYDEYIYEPSEYIQILQQEIIDMQKAIIDLYAKWRNTNV